MNLRKVWASVVPVILVFSIGCGGGDTEAPAESASPEPVEESVPTGSAGISGKVTVEGDVPEAEVIRMNADPVCVQETSGDQLTEFFLLGEEGALGNVFVYVKEGVSGTFDPPSPAVTMDQKGCRYNPHVFGVQVGQTVTIVNSDPTLHNVHALPANNEEFNMGQPVQNMKMDRTFDTEEIMVPFKCDVHGWMNAYVGVLSHPFFAVSGEGGSFSIDNLPAGDYVVEAWHEKLGTQTQNVTVGDGEKQEISFTFSVS